MSNQDDKYKVNGQATHPKRVPIHQQKSLSAKTRTGFVRRIVNEELGRVESFKMAGWTVVEGRNENDSDIRAQNGTQLGTEVRYVVNRDHQARCSTAVLMEIPEELYNEDYLEQQKDIAANEAGLDPQKAMQRGADYGSMQLEGSNRKDKPTQ